MLFLVLATVFGCSKGDQPTYANVKGTVLYNGKPLDKGMITFELVGRPPQIMEIVGGEFNGQAMAGENKISVSAKKKSANAPKLPASAQAQISGYMKYKKNESGGSGSPAEYDPSLVEYIPPEWGTESKQKRVVEAGVNNQFEFSIKGK
jgi:hypothetical protein